MNEPDSASPTETLIENLAELQRLVEAAQQERICAIDLRRAFELLQSHKPFARSTKASLQEVEAAEYRAKDLSGRVTRRMKTLLLAASQPRARKSRKAANVGSSANVVQNVGTAGDAESPTNPFGKSIGPVYPLSNLAPPSEIYQPKRGCQRKLQLSVAWLYENRDKYPQDQWLAFDGSDLVESDPFMPGLIAKLDRRRVPYIDVCLLYNQSLAAGIIDAVD